MVPLNYLYLITTSSIYDMQFGVSALLRSFIVGPVVIETRHGKSGMYINFSSYIYTYTQRQ